MHVIGAGLCNRVDHGAEVASCVCRVGTVHDAEFLHPVLRGADALHPRDASRVIDAVEAKNEVWLSRTPPKLSFSTVSVKGDCAPTAVLRPTLTEGVSRTKSMKSRPEMGRSAILGVSITWLTSDFSVSIL